MKEFGIMKTDYWDFLSGEQLDENIITAFLIIDNTTAIA